MMIKDNKRPAGNGGGAHRRNRSFSLAEDDLEKDWITSMRPGIPDSGGISNPTVEAGVVMVMGILAMIATQALVTIDLTNVVI